MSRPAQPTTTSLPIETPPPIDRLVPIQVSTFFARPTVEVARALLGKILICRANSPHEPATGGRIVEVEAYLGRDDPGSHASRGKNGGMTPRNAIMFGPPGLVYVYFVYGNHHMLNFVTEDEPNAGAVLIRAIEPWYGLDQMAIRRSVGASANARASADASAEAKASTETVGTRVGIASQRELTPSIAVAKGLTNGPGKVSQALGVTMTLNGVPVTPHTMMVYSLPAAKTDNKHSQSGLITGHTAPHDDNTQLEISVSGRIGLAQGGDLPLRFFLANNPFVSKGRYVSIP